MDITNKQYLHQPDVSYFATIQDKGFVNNPFHSKVMILIKTLARATNIAVILSTYT